MTSIREVARLAGVSAATVSRVLNGTAKVDAEKEKRVQEVIKETGFVPNEVARALFKKSSKMIGIVTDYLENPILGKIARCMEEAAYKKGYHIVLCSANGNYEKVQKYLQSLKQMNADGVIVISADKKLQLELENFNQPIVMLDWEVHSKTKGYHVSADFYEGACLATEQLVLSGCKNIVHILDSKNYQSDKEKLRGYYTICEKYHLEKYVVTYSSINETVTHLTERIMEQYPQVDGISSGDDLLAQSLIKAFQTKNVQIPEKIQLVGFGNVRILKLIATELTTISFSVDKIAEKAIEIITDREQEPATLEKEYMFSPQLIKGKTTLG